MAFNTCMTRSSTSSVYFDIFFATLSANIDEELDNNTNDVDNTMPVLPDTPSWWFYNFRIYSQLVLLFFNVAKFIYSASQNDTNSAVLSAVRSICVLGIIVRHYYLCNYKFMALVHGKLTPHLMPLQVIFMSLYMLIGAISGGIDPFFASDKTAVIIFFILPIFFRGLSFATSSLYTKAMTKTLADGTVVIPSVTASFSYTVHYSYGTILYFSLAGSNSTSLFFTDRVLCGLFFFLSAASTARSLMKREKKREQVFVELRRSLNDLEDSVDRTNDDDDVNSQSRIDTMDVTTLHDHRVHVLELRKRFTENKVFALVTTVGCTFMIIVSFELAMSMYIYQRDGVPANWCEPFSFLIIDKGFQVVLDYFL